MTGPEILALWHAQGVSPGPLQSWIQHNVIPLILLDIAITLFWSGRPGDNLGVVRRSVGLIVDWSRWSSSSVVVARSRGEACLLKYAPDIALRSLEEYLT